VAGDAFDLSITPIYVASQAAMIDEATEIEVLVRNNGGDETTFALLQGEDQAYTNTEIRSLDDAEVFLIGRNQNGVIFHGRSEPITLSSGAASVYIFVARDGEPLTLPELDAPAAMGSTHALGNGRYLSIGGSREGSRVQNPMSDVTIFDMRRLGLGDSTETLNSSVHAGTTDGWTGHTATQLTDGRILIAGGAQQLTNVSGDLAGQSSATTRASVLDPSADTVIAVDALSHGRFGHQATLGPDDTVVVTGGFAARDTGVAVVAFAELYDVNAAAWTVSDDVLYTGGVFHAQARLGDEGVLVCGGMDASFTPSSECQLILPDGSIRSAPDLSEPLLHAQLTDLGDGRALLTGGLLTPDPVGALTLDSNLNATSAAWVLDDTTWRPVGSMSIPRALHSAQRTSDGRVVIAGGVARIDSTSSRAGQAYGGLLYDAADALPCVEVFDPATESFTALSACGPGSASGTIPSPVALPGIAHDSVFGTLIAGGLTPDPRQSSVQRTLLYPRFADRDQVE